MVENPVKYVYIIVCITASISWVYGTNKSSISRLNLAIEVKDALSSFKNNLSAIFSLGDIRNASDYTSFLFHSRQSGAYNGTTVKTGDWEVLLDSGFRTSKLTKILIHGWFQNGSDEFSTAVTNAFLEESDLNILAVTWARFAFSSYFIAHNAVPYVGMYVASFVDFLVQEVGVDISSIHVVGHSLGSQIAGVAGENVVSGKLPRISGLDPAGPLYSGTGPQGRLDASDAEFVDVIHTAAGSYGYADPCGTVDFYANGGYAPQPGCIGKEEPSCSHHRSFYFFAESVSSEGFVATRCNSQLEYVTGRCADNETAVMGYHVDTRSRGVFYLTTNAESPYAQS